MACTVFPTPISSARSSLPPRCTPKRTPSLWKGSSALARKGGMQLTLAVTSSLLSRCGRHLRDTLKLQDRAQRVMNRAACPCAAPQGARPHSGRAATPSPGTRACSPSWQLFCTHSSALAGTCMSQQGFKTGPQKAHISCQEHSDPRLKRAAASLPGMLACSLLWQQLPPYSGAVAGTCVLHQSF